MLDRETLLTLIESLEKSPHRKILPFEFALSALFRRVSRVSFDSIEVDLNLIFGVEIFVVGNDFFDDRNLLM
jgi:hypothetical protein